MIVQITTSPSVKTDHRLGSIDRLSQVAGHRKKRAGNTTADEESAFHQKTVSFVDHDEQGGRVMRIFGIILLALGVANCAAVQQQSNVSTPSVSSFGGFRTPAAELAALSFKRPASETLRRNGSCA
jgi:hypothetical protein